MRKRRFDSFLVKIRALFILQLHLAYVVVGTGQFVVRLHSYDNPTGTDFNGSCCDSDVLRCQLDKCDLKIDICVGRNRGGFDCTYGTKQVIPEPNYNNIYFNESQKLIFPITTSLKDPLFIKVNVTDQDTGGASVLVDTFHFVFNTAAFYNSTVIEYQDYLFNGDRPQLRSKLNLSVSSYCDQNYYGPDCDINCVAEDYGCSGHYKCGVSGEKICHAGWTGKDCDVQIPGGVGDCGFYKDSTELLPSLWGGVYTCPDRPSEKIQMNVTPRNKDEILTSAVLTFDGITVTATGSYGYRTLLIQGKPNQKNITDVTLHGIQQPTNLSSMAGELTFNGDRTCTVALNLQKSYLNQCGSGTCVRFGQRKNEFYCCCDGKEKHVNVTFV
ncbi:delta-like protein D [Saccostrea cucullata]|uniref:delta-like protein D n=1 Tax=Saccostrea cuccullata TaxID=36930 RepID=UPI002ED422A5